MSATRPMTQTGSAQLANMGFLLFALGTGIAIASGAKLPAAGATWPTTIPAFVLGTLLAAAGIFVWRKGAKAGAVARKAEQPPEENPRSLLEGALAKLNLIKIELTRLDSQQLRDRLDEVLERNLLPFAMQRQQLIDDKGMDEGAEILVTVAYGERLLNRMWSASADDCLPEAHAVFPEAHAAIQQAVGMFK